MKFKHIRRGVRKLVATGLAAAVMFTQFHGMNPSHHRASIRSVRQMEVQGAVENHISNRRISSNLKPAPDNMSIERLNISTASIFPTRTISNYGGRGRGDRILRILRRLGIILAYPISAGVVAAYIAYRRKKDKFK